MPDPPITPSTDLVMPSRSYSDLNVSAAKPRVSNHEGHPSFETTAAQPPQDEGGNTGPKKGPQTGPRRQALQCPMSDYRLPRVRPVRNLARLLNLIPDLLLGEIHQARENDQEDHDLKADTLARHHVGLRHPHQEGSDVFGILIKRLRRTVVEGHLAVLQCRRYRNGMAREIFVVLHTGR